MFGFLKDKLKGIISGFSKKAEEKAVEELVDEKAEELVKEEEIKEEEKAEELEEIKGADEKAEELEEIKGEEKAEGFEEEIGGIEEEKPEKEVKEKLEVIKEAKERVNEEKPKTIGERIREKVTTAVISEQRFEELFAELELVLLENNVAMEVVGKIKEDLKMDLVNVPIEKKEVNDAVKKSLRESVNDALSIKGFDLVSRVKEKKPFVILFFGINGSGKTTTIAKVANLLQKNRLKCVLSASDTFRAAAIQQLEEHARKLGVKMIKHDYGADPAAVAFDAIKYAEAHSIDVVLIDTAGRMHSNINLIDEMKKIVRVAKPDLKLFVGEAITGNDCVEQARRFNEAVGIDGIILAKADVDDKGGAAISTSFVTRKPILYLGTGQGYDDLQKFSPEIVVNNLGL